MIIGDKLDLHNNPNRLVPNVYFQQAFTASRELLGNDGFVAVIKHADTILPGMARYLDEKNWPPANTDLVMPARHYSAFFQAIEEVGGGRAQMVTIGMKTAQMGFDGLGTAMKATLSVLKRLPGFRWRAETVLKAMADDLMDVFPGDREMQAIGSRSTRERRHSSSSTGREIRVMGGTGCAGRYAMYTAGGSSARSRWPLGRSRTSESRHAWRWEITPVSLRSASKQKEQTRRKTIKRDRPAYQ